MYIIILNYVYIYLYILRKKMYARVSQYGRAASTARREMKRNNMRGLCTLCFPRSTFV